MQLELHLDLGHLNHLKSTHTNRLARAIIYFTQETGLSKDVSRTVVFGRPRTGPLLAIYHSYSDESGKKSDTRFTTFSCLFLHQAKLRDFELDWERQLRKIGVDHLHMKKATRLSESYGNLPRKQTYSERTDALRPFADCINEHFEVGTMIAVEVAAFNSLSPLAKKKIAAEGKTDNPYFMSFIRSTMYVLDRVPEKDYLCVVCDDDDETAQDCHKFYRDMKKHPNDWPETKKMVCIAFADDKHYPALQAADMLAFLFRLEAAREIYRDHYEWVPLFNHLAKPRGDGFIDWHESIVDKKMALKLNEEFEKAEKRSGK